MPPCNKSTIQLFQVDIANVKACRLRCSLTGAVRSASIHAQRAIMCRTPQKDTMLSVVALCITKGSSLTSSYP